MEDFRFLEWWILRLQDLRVAAVSFLVLTVLTRFTWKSITVRYKKKQIPEPPAWPVIGHLHLLGKLPHQTLMKLARQYGPLMSIRLGSLPVVVASTAEMAREFLKTQDGVWASRAPTHFGEFFFYKYNDVVTQPLNEFWRKMKRIYFSEFLSAARVEKQKDQRHESTMRMVNSLLASQLGSERPVEVYAAVAHMNFYHMRKLIFGRRLSLEYTDCASTTGEKKTLAQMIRDVTTIHILSLGDCFPWLRWLDLDGVERKLKKIHSEFDSFLSELLEARRGQLLDGGKGDESEDLVSNLQSMIDKEDGRGLTNDNIKGTISDMFAAGVETTAGVVTFAVAEVMRHPDVKRKLLTELDDAVGRERLVNESDLVNLKYLKMVLKEALRLYPSIPLLIHCSTAPTVVAGYHIPAGVQVLVNVYSIQRDPKVWPDPLAFKPERFSNSSVDVKGQQFELLPFGSGRRQCPGMNMGMTTSELVLARLFQTLDISLPPGMKPQDVDMTEERGAAMGLATPLRVIVSPRLPPQLYAI